MQINHEDTKTRRNHEGICLLCVSFVPSWLRGWHSLLLVGLFLNPFFLTASLTAQPPSHPPIEPPPTPKSNSINKKLLRFVEDDAPVRGETENRDEANAFDYTVKFARDVSIDDLRQSARRDVTFAQMLGPDAANYRGEVVHVEGRLKRIRDIGPTSAMKAEGIEHLYEGWIFSEIYREYAYCVLFTELPSGLQVAEQLDRRVTFDGFFFKIYRFGAGDGVRKAPLLIGRTLSVLSVPTKTSLLDEMSLALPYVLTVLAVVVGLGGGVVLWLRASDHRTRAKIDQARGKNQEIPTPDVFHDPNPFDGSPSVN